jgi:hypothetical protein
MWFRKHVHEEPLQEWESKLLFFYPENGGRKFLRNVYKDLPHYTPSHSQPPTHEKLQRKKLLPKLCDVDIF